MEFVFVAGLPRSGTTIMGAMLDGHPDILTWPFEFRYFTGFWGGIPGEESKSGESLKPFAAKLAQPFRQHEIDYKLDTIRVWGKVDHELLLHRLTSIPSNAKLDAHDFLALLANAFREAHHDYRNRSPRFFALKTMLAGIDWSRPLRGKIIIMERPEKECYSSSKQKALTQQNLTLRQWYGHHAIDVLMQTRLLREIRNKYRSDPNFLFLPLEDVQEAKGKRAAQRVARFLNIAEDESLSRPTLLGNLFGGHYLDRRLNTGTFNAQRSAAACLNTLEEQLCCGRNGTLQAAFAEPLYAFELLKMMRALQKAENLMRYDLTQTRGKLVPSKRSAISRLLQN